MIEIPVVDGRGLIYDVELVKDLRERFHMCGVLNGILPQFAQQNVFMGLPLQLMPEEVKFLLDRGFANAIDGESSRLNHHEALNPGALKEEACGQMVKIPGAFDAMNDQGTVSCEKLTLVEPRQANFNLYEYLLDSGYYVMPGLRFGCHFMAYPGDPMRYHAHHNATGKEFDEEFDILDIVGGGRLATAVKKCNLIGARDDNGCYRSFCIEWAAFG